MHVYTVTIREDTYYGDLVAIFAEPDIAEEYADRLREAIDDEVIVDTWAVNDSLPSWDGEDHG